MFIVSSPRLGLLYSMWLAGLGWSRATVEALITWECIIPDEEASFQDDYIRITTELLQRFIGSCKAGAGLTTIQGCAATHTAHCYNNSTEGVPYGNSAYDN